MDEPVASHQLSSSSRASAHHLLLDHACEKCIACEAGWPVWCEQPTPGQAFCSVPVDLGAVEASGMLMAASAFLSSEIPSQAVVLVVAAEGEEAILDLLRLVHSGTVLLASDPRDLAVKKQLAELNGIGRADVVVSLHSGRNAVLAVKRGGTVCLPEGVVDMPTVTELAQREVRVVGPRSISELVKKVGRLSVEKVFERSCKGSLQLR